MPRHKSAKIGKQLPKNMPSWGKVRIAGGGDQIRTAAVWNRLDRERNMSYMQVRFPIDQITSVYLKKFHSMRWKFSMPPAMLCVKSSMDGWI